MLLLRFFFSLFLDSTCANLTLTKNNKTESNWNTFARLLFDVYTFELCFLFLSFIRYILCFVCGLFCFQYLFFVRVCFLFACSSAISQSEADKHEQICIISNNDNEADSSVVNVHEFPQRPNEDVKQKRNIQTVDRWWEREKNVCGFYLQMNRRHIFFCNFHSLLRSFSSSLMKMVFLFFVSLPKKKCSNTGIFVPNRLLRSRWSITGSIDTTIYALPNSCQRKRAPRLDSGIASW